MEGDVRRRGVAEVHGQQQQQEPEEDEDAIETRRAAVRERCVHVPAALQLCAGTLGSWMDQTDISGTANRQGTADSPPGHALLCSLVFLRKCDGVSHIGALATPSGLGGPDMRVHALRLKQRQEQELLAPAADDEEDEEEESEYETDSEEEDGFGRAMLKPVFVPKVR